ncbi:MAG: dephospho-CoA kinase [Ferrovum sp. 37-45-19]|jgi:dephospho-CoA kinase|uniref:dephospho-CoA kinase n=1 Tax=Ferrovum sp. JA12 TaxID=1356299 RepID=UPI00070388C5|nr:dephospho-CoA kinase [Ferrovum sp. JA12]OYV80563.1 MAG: dephospho-CoA kinase [Ferrovum sp. 21-44-67]OYV94878.1 MAG: dephospho-CoA kinase [Ferrovum sp. 37-45-19]OZB34089.1 MAG: dephospho-CoA kinase [Ferrovum sp. 34-44-207]HQT80989.1 dephospho-CoA kinase [Ferrovaceae bacterium]KRH79286.1 dephospho-CoA kinase [Ferrovum sp. JA12]
MKHYIIGMTGGIGSGKSTVAKMFADLGACVVDTDAISHQLTGPHGGAMGEIEAKFGEEFINDDGSLNRQAMRDYVFNHPPARKKLEAILHGRIREAVNKVIEQATEPYILLVVPLLIEVGTYRPIISRVLVVDCEESAQIERASLRPDMNPDAVRAIMAAQTDRKTRLRVADDVIDNSGSLSLLEPVVKQLDQRYRHLALHRSQEEI